MPNNSWLLDASKRREWYVIGGDPNQKGGYVKSVDNGTWIGKVNFGAPQVFESQDQAREWVVATWRVNYEESRTIA